MERANPLVWPWHGSVEPDQARVECREIARLMLSLDEQDLPVAPVDRCVHSFWLYQAAIRVREQQALHVSHVIQ